MADRTIYKIECRVCDRQVHRSKGLPKGWSRAERYRPLRVAESLKTDPLAWQTHFGLCPEHTEELEKYLAKAEEEWLDDNAVC